MSNREYGSGGGLERISGMVTAGTGSSGAFACAVGVVVVWLILGPVFDYSDTWQPVINTGTDDRYVSDGLPQELRTLEEHVATLAKLAPRKPTSRDRIRSKKPIGDTSPKARSRT
jgi:hypothetical protein